MLIYKYVGGSRTKAGDFCMRLYTKNILSLIFYSLVSLKTTYNLDFRFANWEESIQEHCILKIHVNP